MKLARRENFMAVEVFDPATNSAYLASPEKDLYEVPENPNGIWDYCRYLEQKAREGGIAKPEIYVIYISALNGRPFQLFVKPNVAINQLPRPNLQHADWLISLEQDVPIGLEQPDELRQRLGLELLQQAVLRREADRRARGVDTSGYFEH